MTATEFIDIIAPEHDRTSCSNENLNNSFYLDEENKTQGRSRCSLLEIVKLEGKLPDYFEPNEIFY